MSVVSDIAEKADGQLADMPVIDSNSLSFYDSIRNQNALLCGGCMFPPLNLDKGIRCLPGRYRR